MDMIQQTNKELLLEIIVDIKFIKNEIKEIKKILKDNEENEQRHLPEIDDRINSWFWSD
tara:strand:- start:548 stop:724 length:177 start_codon:yes stop_codon:yes gene_type:complete